MGFAFSLPTCYSLAEGVSRYTTGLVPSLANLWEGPQKGDMHTMPKITVGIHAVLKKDGAKDIDLVVHQYYVGQPSPCVVIRDGDRWGVGGNIETIEEILEFEISKSSGYTVQRSVSIEFETVEEE